MTLLIHIGTHETGTSAIQRFAAANRQPLRERGLWYPSYEEIGLAAHFGHHDFAHAIAGDSGRKFTLADAERFADLIRTDGRADETILISAEPIYRHLVGAGDYWSRRRDYIQRLRDIFAIEDSGIVAVFRRQDGFARSMYQERIKSTKYSKSFRKFLQDSARSFEYLNQIALFKERFAQLTVMIHEDMPDQGLVDAFFNRLGVDVTDLPKPRSATKALPIELIEYKRLLNTTKASMDFLKDAGAKLRKWADKHSSDRPQETEDWIPAEEMADFYASFADSNEQLRRLYASDHPAPLFPPFEIKPLQEYHGMSVDRFAQLTAAILL